jgi:hypothetical protein
MLRFAPALFFLALTAAPVFAQRDSISPTMRHLATSYDGLLNPASFSTPLAKTGKLASGQESAEADLSSQMKSWVKLEQEQRAPFASGDAKLYVLLTVQYLAAYTTWSNIFQGIADDRAMTTASTCRTLADASVRLGRFQGWKNPSNPKEACLNLDAAAKKAEIQAAFDRYSLEQQEVAAKQLAALRAKQ